MKILLIEDEVNVCKFIKKGLEEQTFTVNIAYDGETGLSMYKSNTYDLIILDVVLPKYNGFDVCRTIRKHDSIVPILMLTALGTLNDRVTGLDSGADDYLIKPFHFEELLARVRALTRRNNPERRAQKTIRVDNLTINFDTKEVRRGEELISLTAREFRLLGLLVQNKGRVLSRAEIAEKIWEQSFESGSNVIDVYVNYLRKKIDTDQGKKLIHTIIGMGYVLRD